MNNSNNKNIQKPLYQSRSRYRTKNQSKINLDLIRVTNRQKIYAIIIEPRLKTISNFYRKIIEPTKIITKKEVEKKR